MTFRMPLAVLAAVACCAFVKPASASVYGSLDIANCSGGSISLSATSISFLPAGSVPATGCITTGAGTNLTYSGGTVNPGVFGNIGNISMGSLPLDQFMIFTVSPGLDFVLTGIGPGLASNVCTGLSMGQSCSPSSGSPYVLTSLGASTIVSFSAFGTVVDDGITSYWSGAFSSQVNGSAAAIQNILATEGSIGSTYSGQFNVIVPEPSTFAMLMAGAVLVLAGLKRRKT